MSNLKPAHDTLRDLNEREQKILRLLGEGMSMMEISAALALSYKTFANAVAVIRQKTKAPTNAALTKLAVESRARE
jgi:two-component system, NarL family, invasion response regulator UvrY